MQEMPATVSYNDECACMCWRTDEVKARFRSFNAATPLVHLLAQSNEDCRVAACMTLSHAAELGAVICFPCVFVPA